jgi:predicted AlkP superfamily phosphohydrolase/phosphomutase
MGAAEKRKLLALGIDAGDLGYLENRRSQLPAIAKLLDQSSVFQPAAPKALSGSVWPTFYTGKHPGHHGIYQHLVWDAERMGLRRIGADWCEATPFWQALEQRGLDVIVIDVPYSFPVYLKRGVEITDWGTHGQTYPAAGNRAEVTSFLRSCGPGVIGRETPVQKTPRQLDRLRHQLIESAAKKGELISRSLRAFPWQVCIAVFGEVHRGGHTLYSDSDERSSTAETPLLDIYRAVDKAIARILGEVDLESTTVVLFSVHGMMRDNAQGHLVRPVMQRINRWFLGTGNGAGPGIIGRLREWVPARLQHAVGAAAPDAVRQWVVEQEIVGGKDWSRTPGFALRTDIRTELRLNLQGRERAGILDTQSAAYAAYRELAKQTFLELRDTATNTRLVDEVVDIPKLFPGKRSHALPDLVVTWNQAPSARHVHSPRIGSLEVEPTGARGGDHTDSGFAVVTTPDAGSDTENLPALNTTWDFAAFLSQLAQAA